MPRARLVLPLLLLTPLGASAAPPGWDLKAFLSPAAPAAKPILLPGGIADPAGRVGYLSSAAGGIEALDLKTGEVLWETVEAQRPLLFSGSRLVAQAGLKRNRVRVLVFEGQTGECVLESDPVVLPAWVVAGTAPGRSFNARWRLERNQVVLAWEAEASYAGTGRPTAEQQAAARKHAAGVARIDLDTGLVELGPAEHAKPEPPQPAKEVEKMAVRWQGSVGPLACAVVLEESSGGQSLVLRLWDPATGKAAEPKELLRGRRLLVQPTLDGRHLALRDAASGPDEKGVGRPSRDQTWTLFPLDLTGPIRKVPYEAGTQSLAVVGPRVLYAVAGPVPGAINRQVVQPRTLKAVSLETGKIVWERPVAGKPLTPPVN
jgi:hypothetical protein